MIVNDNVELIEDCIAHKDYKTAREHLRTLKATVPRCHRWISNDTEIKITGFPTALRKGVACDFCYLGFDGTAV